MTRVLRGATALVWLLSCGHSRGLQVRALHPGESVALERSGREAELLVRSASGIGRLTLAPRGDWPEVLWVKLTYRDGRGFSRLEEFALQDDGWRCTTCLGCPDSVECAGRRVFVPVRADSQALTVRVPLASLGASDRLTLSWVDVFRP